MPSLFQNIVNQSRSKTEQTSTTYGQMIEILTGGSTGRSSGGTGTTSTRSSDQQSVGNHAAVDTVVSVVRNDHNGGNLILTDQDRTNIAIAAATSQQPTVAVNTSILPGENVLANNSPSVSAVIPAATDTVVVVGSCWKPLEQMQEILTEANKIDMMITLKTKDSEILEFNNIKEVQMESQFVYNFFSASEADISSQEDPSQDPFLRTTLTNVPKYVKLTWEPAKITEPLSDQELRLTQEAAQLKREVFETERTEATFVAPLNREGIRTEVVDMHNPALAIESTSNRNVFANTMSAVLNIRKNPNLIEELPLRDLFNGRLSRSGRGGTR